MILITCAVGTSPTDFKLVAQNPVTYELLGFAPTGDPVDYSEVYSIFNGNARYLPRVDALPSTEIDLRIEFFTNQKVLNLLTAKLKRESLKVAPIEIKLSNGSTYKFDMDKDSQSNINNAISSFSALLLSAVTIGWPNNGTIPWVTEDNRTVALSKEDLTLIKDSGASRGLLLHMEYTAARQQADSFIPPLD